MSEPRPGAEPVDRLLGSTRTRRRFASIQAAAVAGLVCAVAWMLSLRGMLSGPGIGASDAEITEYFAERANATAMVVWLQVLVVGTVAFLWFVGVVRGRLGDQEPKLFGTVFFGSAILLAALLFAGATLVAAPAVLVTVGDRAPSPEAVSLMRAAAAIAFSVFAPRIATLVMFSTATLARATGALPMWLVWLTYAIGVVEFLNVTISVPSLYVVPAWIALVSIVLLVRRPPHGLELETPTPDAPGSGPR
jgi:hypothetical protein